MNPLSLRPSDEPAVIEASSGQTLTYAEVLALGTEICTPLEGSKQFLLVLARNDVFTLLVYAGALSGGHAVALIDAQVTAETLSQLVMHYQPQWVAGPVGLGARLNEAGVDVADSVAFQGGEFVRVQGAPAPKIHTDLAVLLATSGTTGSRKLVRLSAVNVQSNARSIAKFLGLSARERPITTLPLHYSFGLSVLNSHWLIGAAVVVSCESVMQRPFWDQVRAHSCTSLAGVPYTYQQLERVGFRQMELPSVTTLQQAGGALDQRLAQLYAENMRQRGGRLFVMYGQTEATARMAYVPPEQLPLKAGSAGIAIPGGRLSVDEATSLSQELPRGEVVYEGPNVMMGYAAERADLALGDTLNGFLRTGDIGYLDADGFLYIVGRSKRIAKVFGIRMSLDDVEAELTPEGPAAVVASAEVVWGFCAFGTDEELNKRAKELALRHKVHHSALQLRRVAEIPMTTTGKTDYERVHQWIG